MQTLQLDTIFLNEHYESQTDIFEQFEVPNFDNDLIKNIVNTKYKGTNTDNQRAYFLSKTYQEIKTNYEDFYRGYFNEIEADAIILNDNRTKNIFTVEEFYSIKSAWSHQSKPDIWVLDYHSYIIESAVNYQLSTNRKIPFTTTYPKSIKYRIEFESIYN